MSAFRDAVVSLPEAGAAAVGTTIAANAFRASTEELALLTRVLANSGDLLDIGKDSVDIASTGGPGSLTTLLSPLAAHASGRTVSKIAVPGRPAGGIDTLGSVPGFKTVIGVEQSEEILLTGGYLHTSASGSFCPLDSSFFLWRQKNGAQAIPELAVASLLAKKLAAGVRRVVLDVRVGSHGNFGADLDSARTNARRFVEVAALLGITAKCALSGMAGLAQPYIGRGEALLALELGLSGNSTGWLRDHVESCLHLARLVSRDASKSDEELLVGATASHRSMLSLHGVEASRYVERISEIEASQRVELVAETSGFLEIDIGRLRRVIVDRQRAIETKTNQEYSDPCGLILSANTGDRVVSGEVIAQIRDSADSATLAGHISAAFTVNPTERTRSSTSRMELVT